MSYAARSAWGSAAVIASRTYFSWVSKVRPRANPYEVESAGIRIQRCNELMASRERP